jgi:uncharacterized membrane protein
MDREIITGIIGGIIGGGIADVLVTKFFIPRYPKWFTDKDGNLVTDGLIDVIIKYFKKRKEKKEKQKNDFSSPMNV